MKTRKSSIYIRLKRNLSIHSFLYFLVISVSPLIMSSCASVHPFIMEVRQPAQVSLPLDIAEVIVVDNSLSQPSDIGITQSYNEKPLDSSDIELNLSPSVIQSLSQTLLNANFFNDVSYARTPVREQGDWITEHTQIPLSVQNSLMDTLGYDGIISLDRILFSIDEKVKDNLPGNSSYPSHYVDLKITAQANGSIYIYNQEKPFHLFTVSNSITVKDTYYEDSLTVIKYLPEVFLRDVAHNIGIKAANIILPSWSPKERYIYSGVGARMREAFSYAKNNKWEEARKIWLKEYEKKEKALDKGKTTHNIALSYEVEDQLEEALKWALQAQNYFLEAKLNPESKEMIRINNYITDIKKRIEDNRLLNEQLGI